MRKLITWDMASIDGFFEGESGDISWHEEVWGEELEALSIAQCEDAGMLIFGRITYELMAGYWPAAPKSPIADCMNALPKTVFSKTLEKAEWNNTTLLRGDAANEVARLKRQPGGNIYLFGSATLAASLLRHGMIDEIRIGVAPLLLGGGEPLFKPGAAKQNLKLLEARPLSNGVIIQRYAPTARMKGE